jgi:hypothetical protein
MDNFIEVLGLEDLVERIPTDLRASNFENLYSNLHNDNPDSELIKELEKRIRDYFSDLTLPNEPTIYDYLIFSLRSKDLIATFNWDPFLYQAWCRVQKYTSDVPNIAFLHGNVAIGYSTEDKASGPAGMYARKDGGYFEPTKLLYPIEKKDYNSDNYINGEWDKLKFWLNKKSTKRVTIFGYGAPSSDIEAVSLLNESWGSPDDRNMEQFEIIDISDEKALRERWDGFIHSHHYDVSNDYFKSSLAVNPRRTSESFFSHYMPMSVSEAFRHPNPVPSDFKTLDELYEWHKPLLQAEKEKSEEKTNKPQSTKKKIKKKKRKPRLRTNQQIVDRWRKRKRSKRTRIKRKHQRKKTRANKRS